VWYEEREADRSPIVSSRIRLARNLRAYSFSRKISVQDAQEMIERVKIATETGSERIGQLSFTDVFKLPDVVKLSMLERHILSPQMLQCQGSCGLLTSEDNSLALLLNEEDHIRIQAFTTGGNIDAAFAVADSVDDILEDTLDYAYSDSLGYLTSCPSNTGTGLRASYMVHLPMLERANQLRKIVPVLTQFGMTIRGVFGEGSESFGSFYQISNQKTLGESEQEILGSLKKITRGIIDREEYILKKSIENDRYELLDSVHRAYGILTNCRRITAKEAMMLLSSVRLGYTSGLLKAAEPGTSLLAIMMNIRDANIALYAEPLAGEVNSAEPRDVARAQYLRSIFSG